MNTHKLITMLGTLIVSTLMLLPASNAAGATREFLTSFIPPEEVNGLAVDLETGNVYVADRKTETIYIYGPNGGAPTDGAPAKIEGLHVNIGHASFIPLGVAVDNSCYEHQPRLTGKECEEYDPSYGDVYVIVDEDFENVLGGSDPGQERGVEKYKLNPEHKYERVTDIGDGAGPNDDSPKSVAVDERGNVYIASSLGGEGYEGPGADLSRGWLVQFKKNIENSGPGVFTERLERIELPLQNITRFPAYLAVGGNGVIYQGSEGEQLETEGGGYFGVAKLTVNEAGGLLAEEAIAGNRAGTRRPLAVNSVTGSVYVGDQQQIKEYDAAGALQLTFGSEEALGGSLGKRVNGVDAIAVNGDAERVYVSNPAHHDIDVFGGLANQPVVSSMQPSVSGVTRTSALLAGTATPESGRANYYFEYVPVSEYEPGAEDPYAQGGQTAVTPLAGGTTPETVERVALTGLRPGVTYHYRMVVVNGAGMTYGPDETFTTAPARPPVAGTGPAVAVGVTGATLTGVVDPRGLATSYVFELGPDTSYGGARLFGEAGSSTGEVPVSVSVQFLVPGTTYHYRLTATSFDGTSYGQDGTFTTPSVTAPVAQPASVALVAAPAGMVFPSIAGAIERPVVKAKKKTKSRHEGSVSGSLRRALRVCARERSKSARSGCRARAHRLFGPGGNSKHSTKR